LDPLLNSVPFVIGSHISGSPGVILISEESWDPRSPGSEFMYGHEGWNLKNNPGDSDTLDALWNRCSNASLKLYTPSEDGLCLLYSHVLHSTCRSCHALSKASVCSCKNIDYNRQVTFK
jgi:hypothetical protein